MFTFARWPVVLNDNTHLASVELHDALGELRVERKFTNYLTYSLPNQLNVVLNNNAHLATVKLHDALCEMRVYHTFTN